LSTALTLGCGQGVQWAYYHDPNSDNPGAGYAGYDPTVFKSQEAPIVQGVTGSAGGIQGLLRDSAYGDFYGHTERIEHSALHYRGYLYAPTAGQYTFTTWNADDIVLIWAGEEAYSGWQRSNALLEADFFGQGGGQNFRTVTATYTATKGEYIPFRVVFSNAQLDYAFYLSVVAPDGTTVLDADSTTSDYLVQYACKDNLAPEYPPYGSE
jgi:hypothetical protein